MSCVDAEAALDRLAVDHELGLLRTDVALGVGMRGSDLADEVRVRFPRLPVLLMSGFSSELFDEPREWELLRKPYTRSELESAIARTLSVFR